MVMSLIWKILPWGGCLLLIWLWHQQGIAHTKITDSLNLTLSQQNETLTAQASSINRLQEELQRNSQLSAQVQQQTGQLIGEQDRAQQDIKEIIIHEACNTTKLPDAAAVRLRQLATAPLDPH